MPHLQPVSVLMEDPRPPVQRPILLERSLDRGTVIGESEPSHRTSRWHTLRQLAAERGDPGREGRALGKFVGGTERV